MPDVDLSNYNNTITRKEQVLRLLFQIVWFCLAKPVPRRMFNPWKLFLLRLFGAKLHNKSVIYSSVNVYMPWNLEMDAYACLAPEVDCYNVAKISVGAHSTVSQKTFLCSASHDVTKSNNPLITVPITIKDQVWIGASVFIGMGVTVGQGAVVGATASVYKNVDDWTIVGGNPAKFIKKREING